MFDRDGRERKNQEKNHISGDQKVPLVRYLKGLYQGILWNSEEVFGKGKTKFRGRKERCFALTKRGVRPKIIGTKKKKVATPGLKLQVFLEKNRTWRIGLITG